MTAGGLNWIQWVTLIELPVLAGVVWFFLRGLANKHDNKTAEAFAKKVAEAEARQHAENEKLWRRVEGLRDDTHQIALGVTEIRTLVEAIRGDLKSIKGGEA